MRVIVAKDPPNSRPDSRPDSRLPRTHATPSSPDRSSRPRLMPHDTRSAPAPGLGAGADAARPLPRFTRSRPDRLPLRPDRSRSAPVSPRLCPGCAPFAPLSGAIRHAMARPGAVLPEIPRGIPRRSKISRIFPTRAAWSGPQPTAWTIQSTDRTVASPRRVKPTGRLISYLARHPHTRRDAPRTRTARERSGRRTNAASRHRPRRSCRD